MADEYIELRMSESGRKRVTPAANNAVDVIVAKNPPGIKNDAPIKAAPPIMPSHPPDLAPPTIGTIVITSPSIS